MKPQLQRAALRHAVRLVVRLVVRHPLQHAVRLVVRLALLLLATGLAPAPALAGEGHDHGDAAPHTGGPALPRFAAVSETFELVGVLDGKQLVLYLDRFADNAPVREARIELEIAGAKFTAVEHGDAQYEVLLPQAPKPGVLSITATITAGKEVDLLAGEIDVHDNAERDAPVRTDPWQVYAGWTAGGLAALALLAMLVFGGRRAMKARRVRAGGAA